MRSASRLLQKKNVPLKKLTPIIAKINSNKAQIISTFVIEGIEDSKVSTTSFMPSSLLISFKGLKALSALSTFKEERAEFSCPD